ERNLPHVRAHRRLRLRRREFLDPPRPDPGKGLDHRRGIPRGPGARADHSRPERLQPHRDDRLPLRRRARRLCRDRRAARGAVRDGYRLAQEVMALFWHFLLLGCIAVGGVSTVMPDMYRYVVDERGLVTARQFADLYALAQAAPGPNALWVTLLGLQAAGWT